MQQPSVGRIVHYVGDPQVYGDGLRPGPCRAAIVTNVIEDQRPDAYVDLTVFDPNGQLIAGAVPPRPVGELGEGWHWPERTP